MCQSFSRIPPQYFANFLPKNTYTPRIRKEYGTYTPEYVRIQMVFVVYTGLRLVAVWVNQ